MKRACREEDPENRLLLLDGRGIEEDSRWSFTLMCEGVKVGAVHCQSDHTLEAAPLASHVKRRGSPLRDGGRVRGVGQVPTMFPVSMTHNVPSFDGCPSLDEDTEAAELVEGAREM